MICRNYNCFVLEFKLCEFYFKEEWEEINRYIDVQALSIYNISKDEMVQILIKEYQKRGKSWTWIKANIIQIPVPEEHMDILKKRSRIVMYRIKRKGEVTLIIIQDFINGKRQ